MASTKNTHHYTLTKPSLLKIYVWVTAHHGCYVTIQVNNRTCVNHGLETFLNKSIGRKYLASGGHVTRVSWTLPLSIDTPRLRRSMYEYRPANWGGSRCACAPAGHWRSIDILNTLVAAIAWLSWLRVTFGLVSSAPRLPHPYNTE